MLQRAEAWARARGCVEMGPDTDLENTLSQHVHMKLGYAETERLVTFLRRLD